MLQRFKKVMKENLIKIFNKFNFYHKNQIPKKDYNNFIHGILISLSLEKKRKIKIIQIGANDGVHGDPLYEYIIKFNNRVELLCIEPQLIAFNSLKKNYENVDNIYFSMSYIGDGQKKLFYSLNDNFRKIRGNENKKFDGVSSIEKTNLTNRLKKSGLKNIDNYINSETVQTFRLEDLLKKDPIYEKIFCEIDFLQVDAEGYDDEIIYNSGIEKLNFNYINYEFKNLTDFKLNKLHDFLKNNNYKILRWNKSDEIAYRA
jgi:FkbM family methyltransferase